MGKLKNTGQYEFIDISSEVYREYTFAKGEKIRIEGATDLAVSASGHRLFDGKKSYYVPNGWLALCWEVKSGKPNFIK